MSSDQPASSSTIFDPYEYLQIAPTPDGSIQRLLHDPHTPASSDSSLPVPVLTKDITINKSNNIWVRLFLPHKAFDSSTTKLPIVVFFHGGCFIFFSAASSVFHEFCANMAVEIPTIIVSVNYRLAPEHRLPSAYDDATEALNWIKSTEEKWLRRYGDYSNCYLMGSSAGGNIAYHACLRAAAAVDHLPPLKIRGLMLQQPFFGGIQRTESEKRSSNDTIFPSSVTDMVWDLSLPIGVDRDHEYCNPMVGSNLMIKKIKRLGWRVIVTGYEGDPLIDRQIELVDWLDNNGVNVVGYFNAGGYHGVEDREPSKAKQLHDKVYKNFIYFTSS